MSVDEGHVNQAEFPEAAVQQAREEYSADSDSYGEKDPFKLKKEKKDADKKKKEKGYKTFEAAESFSEEDDERGKGKKRGSLFRNRFAPSAKMNPKEKQKGDKKEAKPEERKPAKEKTKEEKKARGGAGEEKKVKTGVEEKKTKGGDEKKAKGSSEEKKRSKSKEREKMKKKSHTIDVPHVKPEPIFGVPFAEAVERSKLYDNIELPRIVRECIDCVEEYGLTTSGIYRLSGVKSKVEALKAQYNAGEKVVLKDSDPTIITSLLKLYLRELPETVLTTKLTPVFENIAGMPNTEEKLVVFKKALEELPKCNYTLVSWMMVHLAHVLERKEETKMTIQNLSIVMCPTMRISHRTMNLLFTHWKDLFGDVQLKRCPKPLEWIPGTVFEIPETTIELEEELLRHEAILAQMHEDLNRGVADKSTEDHLWEVQRVVTQLKRKLRVSRRVSETRLAAKEKELGGKEPKPASKSPAKTVSPPPKTFKEEETETDTKKEKEEKKPAEDAKKPSVAEEKPEAPDVDEADGSKDNKEKANVKEKADGKEKPGVKEEPKEEVEEQQKEEAKEEMDTRIAVVREEEEEEAAAAVEEEDKDAEPDLEMMKLLLLSQAEVMAEQEELISIRNELHKRIEAERQEIARLQSSILEARHSARRRGASVDSIDSSAASESSSESEDEEELQKILEGLIRENEELRRKNMQLSHNIHNEREACAELRVQIKLREQMPQMLEALAQAAKKDAPQKQAALSHSPRKQAPLSLSPRKQAAASDDLRKQAAMKNTSRKQMAVSDATSKDAPRKAAATKTKPSRNPQSAVPPKQPSPKTKKVAIVEEPKREKTPEIAAGKSENSNTNNSLEVGEEAGGDAGSTVAVVTEEKKKVPVRLLEETAL